ncbi:MAG: response regulator [Terriglobales bacterium]|jgi:DNA-binding NtrC family response regulator
MSTIFQRDCLGCAILNNPCVFCGPLLRVPVRLSACAGDIDKEEANPMGQQRQKVLIVDNDESVLIALQQVMEEEGYETTTSWNLTDALKLMEETSFDVLLVGDHPPDLNCERVLKLLREGQSWTPCVVMHTVPRHPFAVEYLEQLGAHGVACKWNYGEVLEEVRKCVADYHVAA